MPLTALQQCLARAGHGPGDTLLLACSGGRDSQVLLHAAAALWPARQLVVAHVHHGLQGGADDWLDFCAAQAAALGLPFLHRRLPPTLMPDGRLANVESRAREGRYRALAEMAEVAGARMVLTAHHANDQLETIEIRRRRGSGVLGLAGMREQAPLPHAPAGYRLLRPFLGLGRAALAEWAAQQGIRWMDDPSNLDPRFTRNRVRRLLDQQLAGDQQALGQGLAEVGLLQQAADRMLRQAEADMQAASLHLLPATADIADGQNTARRADAALPALSRAALMRLGPARRAEALRYWLGLAGCRMPSRHKLDELERQLLLAASAQAIVHHDGCGLLRHRDRIGRLPPRVPVQPLWWRWQGESSLDTEAGRLHIEQVAMPPPWQQGQQLEGAGRSDRTGPAPVHGSAGEVLLPVAMLSGVELMLDQGRGRDRLRLHPAAPSRSWKNLMQERGVPPCLRASLPVLRAGGHILFAAPFGVTVPAALATGEAPNLPCVRLRWQPLPGVADWL